MELKHYYLIGDHVILIQGGETVAGFESFETHVQHPHLTVNVQHQVPTEVGGIEIFAIECDDVESSLIKNDGGYILHLFRRGCLGPLVMSYNADNCSCVIGGDRDADLLRFALWIAYGLATVRSHTVAVHSSVVVYGGLAVMFLGESGTGKSTHTDLWRRYIDGARLLNDDSPVLRVEGGVPYVYGSPWSGKTPCYRAEKVKLAAIVRLCQAPHNMIRRLGVLEAIGAVYPSCPSAFASDESLSEAVCAILSAVLGVVPVYGMECMPDEVAARMSCSTIFSNIAVL